MFKKILTAALCAFSIGACAEPRAAKIGDIATIDFAGFIDGVQFEGGTAKAYDLKLGSGQFIPGFEEQIVGRKPGEEFDVNITFPMAYHPQFAGKDAVFKIRLIRLR
ncbi:MAG: FKBP-type peptidyl-prolyl cis-trans isomerase [Alphaproteobacteria bacterium]|nr:FKBP-type peptidyl-prolyl cis-trans isomerase [Alphaproteobacteria bacterium]